METQGDTITLARTPAYLAVREPARKEVHAKCPVCDKLHVGVFRSIYGSKELDPAEYGLGEDGKPKTIQTLQWTTLEWMDGTHQEVTPIDDISQCGSNWDAKQVAKLKRELRKDLVAHLLEEHGLTAELPPKRKPVSWLIHA